MRESQELGHKISSHVPRNGKGVCTACGSVLLPQWTVRNKTIAKKARPSRRALKEERVMRRMVRSQRCSFCDRVTKDAIAIGSSLRKEKKKQPAEAAQPSENMMSADTVVEGTNKSSSKKRAKARKDREGLQALLKKSVQTKTLPSLNLMDLMKK
jgi:hypothetical protein